MVEAGLDALGAPFDATRVEYAVREHEQWYKGDGAYGDGPSFHWDYYNSFVIHPMLVDVAAALAGQGARGEGDGAADRRAREALRRGAGASDRPRRHLPADRPFAGLPLRRVPSAGAVRAPPHAPRRRLTRAGPRRADRRHQAHARRAGRPSTRPAGCASGSAGISQAWGRRISPRARCTSVRWRSCRWGCRRAIRSGPMRPRRSRSSARGAARRSRSTTRWPDSPRSFRLQADVPRRA